MTADPADRDPVPATGQKGMTTDALLRAHRKLMANVVTALGDGAIATSASGDSPVHASEDC